MKIIVSLKIMVIFTALFFGANAQTESDILGVFGSSMGSQGARACLAFSIIKHLI